MERSRYSAIVILGFLLLGAVGAWGDVGTAGRSAVSPGQNAGTPGIFAQPFGPNQAGSIPVAPLEPEPGISPIAPEIQQPGIQQPGQIPDNRLPSGTSCAGGLSSTPGFLCPEPGTLPGSIPSTSNSNIFSGQEASPTQPGSSGNVPGQSGSPFGNEGAPINLQPTQPHGIMTPQR